MMSAEKFEKILLQLKGHADQLYFHVMGEPLLHPLLGHFLSLAHAYGYKVNITTNGTLLHLVQDVLLASAALRQVNISLHSFDANANENTMDCYLDRVFEFVRATQERQNILIGLRLWNLIENAQNGKNLHILKRIEQAFHLPDKIDKIPISYEGISLAHHVYLNSDQRFFWPDLERPQTGRAGFCYALRTQIAILVDGTVVPCCLDSEGEMPLGNIALQSIDDILKSERAMAIYEGFSRRMAVEPLCLTCGYRSRFD